MTLKRVRRFTIVVALATWIFLFSVLHDAQVFFKFGSENGPMPEGLVLLLGLGLIVSLGTAIIGGMRLPVWPWLAMITAVVAVAAIFETHYLALKATTREATQQALRHLGSAGITQPALRSLLPKPVTAGAAVREAAAGTVHFFFFILAPLLLLAAGIYGWYYGPRTMFIPEPPRAA